MGDGRDAYRGWVEKPKGRRPLEKPRREWEDNNKNGSSKFRMGI
jgi:hypothetical protein